MKIIFESFDEFYYIYDIPDIGSVKLFCIQKAKLECIEHYKEMIELTKSDNSEKLSYGSDDIKAPFFREILKFKGIEIEVIND
jgi:hypothetical protein